MRLIAVTVSHFKNFFEPQRIEIEEDVTCLVGKNESGKTTILKALHRLNPANGADVKFDVTTEYPRWRLARDRREGDLKTVSPVTAEFALDESDLEIGNAHVDVRLPGTTTMVVSRTYGNELVCGLRASTEDIVRAAGSDGSLDAGDVGGMVEAKDVETAASQASELARSLKESGDSARAKVLSAFATAIRRYSFLAEGATIPPDLGVALMDRMPKFFYFSNYDKLPGEVDLTTLATKADGFTASERTVLALLAHAGETPQDFLDANYDSRKAELQAASGDLSRQAFEYWKQNTDLDVIFDTDMPVVAKDEQGKEIRHRYLKIELRDGRHGGVETNFTTRSAGFQWFFSFFAAFSQYQGSNEPLVVLLDEPGTSLHGEAQKDFVRFVYEELGSSKQTLYTTHSQYMVDPARYEKMRAVHDRATRENPDLGVVVTPVDLSADRDTVLPVESALGYTISQHLFLGSGHHLAVEGSSDFVYLQRVSEFLIGGGQMGLDPRLAAIPVGGDSNMPAFVALLGRRLKVSALIDGARTSAKVQRVLSAAKANGVRESAIVVCSDITGMPTNADIEDLFASVDYLRLYNWAFGTELKVSELATTDEPIVRKLEALSGQYDHALPAHALTEHREEFFGTVQADTLTHFKELFTKLNATVEVSTHKNSVKRA